MADISKFYPEHVLIRNPSRVLSVVVVIGGIFDCHPLKFFLMLAKEKNRKGHNILFLLSHVHQKQMFPEYLYFLFLFFKRGELWHIKPIQLNYLYQARDVRWLFLWFFYWILELFLRFGTLYYIVLEVLDTALGYLMFFILLLPEIRTWISTALRDRPFNLKGGEGYVFFLKKYSDSQCCWKKYPDFVEEKKNNLIQIFCHLT